MPNMNHATDILRVKQIAIDEDGNVTKRFPRIDAEGQLKNTLLFAIHPEICVLSMQVPGGLLDAYEQARISQVLMRVRYEGREYCLIGASGSAKDGKFYAVDAQHEKLIAERFQKWPQAAITYFGILVSDCKVVIQERTSTCWWSKITLWEQTIAADGSRRGCSASSTCRIIASTSSASPSTGPRRKAPSRSCKTTLLIC